MTVSQVVRGQYTGIDEPHGGCHITSTAPEVTATRNTIDTVWVPTTYLFYSCEVTIPFVRLQHESFVLFGHAPQDFPHGRAPLETDHHSTNQPPNATHTVV